MCYQQNESWYRYKAEMLVVDAADDADTLYLHGWTLLGAVVAGKCWSIAAGDRVLLTVNAILALLKKVFHHK